MDHVLGTITMVLAITMVVVGVPAQVRKNHKERRCGMPLMLSILVFSVYVSRTLYALSIEAFYIVIPDVIGAVLSAVMLYQHHQFRESKA